MLVCTVAAWNMKEMLCSNSNTATASVSLLIYSCILTLSIYLRNRWTHLYFLAYFLRLYAASCSINPISELDISLSISTRINMRCSSVPRPIR